MKMTKARPYRMTARAEATAATRERILDAAEELFWELPSGRVQLEEVAARAGVTVQTVIRRFGGRADVIAATGERASERVRRQRDSAPVGDISGAVRVLMDHYEELGDRVLKLLAEESSVPELQPLADQGRTLHRAWVKRTFAPALDGVEPSRRRRLVEQLVAVCDVYTWKLLRRDGGLSRAQTELALTELLQPLTDGAR